MTKYSGWLLSLYVYLSFCSLIIKILFHHLPSSYQLWENQIKKQEKQTIFLVLEKATGLVTQTLVTVTKKEVISNSKTTTLTYFDKLQKKQQDQGGKYFYFSFISKL